MTGIRLFSRRVRGTVTTATCRGLVVTSAMASVLVAACGSATSSPATDASSTPTSPSAALADLAPTGALRVAIPLTPPFLAHKDPTTGQLSGIAIDAGKALAVQLGVTFVAVPYPDPAAALAPAEAGKWDVAFVNASPDAAKVVDRSKAFLEVQHSYLVKADSPIHTVTEVDSAGIRIASDAEGGHTKWLADNLKHATLIKVAGKTEGIALVQSGGADAYASGRFSVLASAAQNPALRVVDGAFVALPFFLGVTKGHAAGLAVLEQFVAQEKSSGSLERSITVSGIPGILVGPVA